MQCPIDNSPLQIADRQGIEIDYCPKCRGVWLDRGELDKLIERSDSFAAPHAQPQRYQDDRASSHRRDDDDDNYRHHDNRRSSEHHGYDEHGRKHKKESFLGDLFDF